MFGRKKTEATPGLRVEEVILKPRKGHTPKKAIPVPSRRKANVADRRPIVANRKAMSREECRELKRERSEADIAQWNKQQEAMRTSDERDMPPQYADPVRRFGRDVIDSRFSPGSYFVPLALLFLAGLFVQRFTPRLFVVPTVSVYTIFIVIAVWTGENVRRARVLAEYKFGADRIPRRFSIQLFSHAFYPRRRHTPRLQVASGNIPTGIGDVGYKKAEAERKKG